ncbi:MAG: hypothetical protein D4R67_11965 [Bacteroidetes bacterium]|nr:MAG: hypothetical protein D4R67_11965 [Bacteroidota bacterium]
MVGLLEIFKAMKEKIIHFFKHDRSYSGGVKLFNEFGILISLKKQLNIQAENQHLKDTLFEALRELGGISMDEFRGIMLTPVKPFGDPQGNPPAPAKTKPAKSGSKKSKGTGKPKAQAKGKKPVKKSAGPKQPAKDPEPPKQPKEAIKEDPLKETPAETPATNPEAEK